jgi:high-affinity K+ transport system ATPase subunit B
MRREGRDEFLAVCLIAMTVCGLSGALSVVQPQEHETVNVLVCAPNCTKNSGSANNECPCICGRICEAYVGSVEETRAVGPNQFALGVVFLSLTGLFLLIICCTIGYESYLARQRDDDAPGTPLVFS